MADRFPPELRRVIEFLNDQMEEAEVLGIELAQYVGSNLRALVPRVVGQTEVIRQRKQATTLAKRLKTKQEFLIAVRVFTDFFERAISNRRRACNTVQVKPGFSLRVQDSKPITLFLRLPFGRSG